ncbi:MAG: RHS repeat-associated core domain-containing protein, partial [Terriglobia bacterium]
EDGDFWATSEWQTDTRRYTPGASRWYTPDPIGKAAARLDFPQTWNMYTYVQNNPTTLTDPSGEFNLLTPLLEAVTPFVSEALDAGSYLVKEVTRSKPKTQVVVYADNPNPKPHQYVRGGPTSRVVDYHAARMGENGPNPMKDADITLHEELDPNSKTQPAFEAKGHTESQVFEDTQAAEHSGDSYRLLRDWSVNGSPVEVLNRAQGTTYKFEVLTVDTNASLPINTTYTNTRPGWLPAQ